MKKKIVFLTWDYEPYHSAVSKCVENVINETKDFEVYVLCMNNPNYKTNKQEKIIRLNHSLDILHEKIIRNVKRVFTKNSLNQKIIEKYYKELSNNPLLSDVDCIIPTCMPYETVYSAILYKKNINPTVKIIPYLFDQFTENDNYHRSKVIKRIKKKMHLEFEQLIAEESDKILFMDSVYRHYRRWFSEYEAKFIVLEHPLLIESKYKVPNNESGIINITYTGSLIKNYIEPDYALSVLKKIISKNNLIKFHVYSFGNYNKKLSKYEKNHPENFFNHGTVEASKAQQAKIESDFLLSISEVNGKQMSSKIFEYMALGKPIIHFYKKNNDVNVKILRKYNISLLIEETPEKYESNIIKIQNFIKTHKNKKINFSELTDLFPEALPITTAEIIKKIINE